MPTKKKLPSTGQRKAVERKGVTIAEYMRTRAKNMSGTHPMTLKEFDAEVRAKKEEQRRSRLTLTVTVPAHLYGELTCKLFELGRPGTMLPNESGGKFIIH